MMNLLKKRKELADRYEAYMNFPPIGDTAEVRWKELSADIAVLNKELKKQSLETL